MYVWMRDYHYCLDTSGTLQSPVVVLFTCTVRPLLRLLQYLSTPVQLSGSTGVFTYTCRGLVDRMPFEGVLLCYPEEDFIRASCTGTGILFGHWESNPVPFTWE